MVHGGFVRMGHIENNCFVIYSEFFQMIFILSTEFTMIYIIYTQPFFFFFFVYTLRSCIDTNIDIIDFLSILIKCIASVIGVKRYGMSFLIRDFNLK